MYLMSIFHSDLKDKCMRTYKRATCETGLYQHQPLQFNSTAWQSSATISTWWRLLLMGLHLMQELCRHLRNAWGSERDAYKTEAAAVFHNQFPVISINPLPHPMSFSHSLLCGQKHLQLTTCQTSWEWESRKPEMLPTQGWIPALPSIMTKCICQRRYGPQESAALLPQNYPR